MAVLITLHGSEAGRQFPLSGERTILGRNIDCSICLTGKQVSRQHAQILHHHNTHFLEDLNSSNGTFVNGKKIAPMVPVPLTETDTFYIGAYQFSLRSVQPPPPVESTEASQIVKESINAVSVNAAMLAQDPAAKLAVVLEISRQLARTLELDPLLDKLLEQLVKLVPQADRIMVILCENDKLIVRAQRARRGQIRPNAVLT